MAGPDDREPEDELEQARPSLVERLSETLDHNPRWRSLAQTGLFLIAFITVLHVARSIAIPLTFALMLYFLLRPAVRHLGRYRIPKPLGSALILLLLMALGALAVRELITPATEWAGRLPQAVRQLERRVQVLRRPVERATELAEKVERVTDVGRAPGTREVTLERPGLLDSAVAAVVELAAELFVTLFAAYFLLLDGDTLLARLFRLVPDVRDRARAGTVINEVERRMSQYLRTVTVINIGLGVVLGAALSLVGMPNPWLWGGMAAMLNYVPYLGSGAGIVIVGLASFSSFRDTSEALLPPLVYLGVTAVEGNLLTPWILGRAFQISPLVVFVWLVFWAWLWSVPGAIVAVPLLMLIKITCEQSATLRPIAALMRS